MKKYLNFINGKWTPPSTEEYYAVKSPYNQEVLATVPFSTEKDVAVAVAAARTAFDSGVWSKKTPAERAACLLKLADLVEKNIDMLAKLEAQDVGKTLKYARDSDMPFVIDNLRFFAGASRMLEGKSASDYSGMGTSLIRREPIGVVAAIVPWNYPLYIAVWKLAPALAAGNCIVMKPASITPLTLLEFAQFTVEAGIPPGVFNVVVGSGHIVGDALMKHPDVDMITFTGDTQTGKKILHESGGIKHFELELGGKAPMIVLKDADLDMAAQGAVVGGFWNTGQDCTAVTRVYVHQTQYKLLVQKMVGLARKLRLGDPLAKNIDMGPLVSARQLERVESYVEGAKKEGAKVACGGKRPNDKKLEQGYFYEPTILTNVKQSSKVCQEEIFGPVIIVMPYTNYPEALDKANGVVYGLAASVYGMNIYDCLEVAKHLHFGTVWVNEHGILTSETPHGGFKQSGFGKDLSMYSFEEYTRIKHIYIDSTRQKKRSWHYTVFGDQ